MSFPCVLIPSSPIALNTWPIGLVFVVCLGCKWFGGSEDSQNDSMPSSGPPLRLPSAPPVGSLGPQCSPAWVFGLLTKAALWHVIDVGLTGYLILPHMLCRAA